MKCEDCGIREAVVTYCDGAMDFAHGNKAELCRQCYIAILERTIKNSTEQIKTQENLILEELNENGGKNGNEK